MFVVGIDPDTKATGVAAVEAYPLGSFRILHLGLVRAKGRKAADRRREMAHELNKYLCSYELHLEGQRPTAVAIEWMHLRPRGEKRPNDILNLNGVAGMCVSACLQLNPEFVFTPIPKEWKGEVPKAIHQRRILTTFGLNSDLCYRGITRSVKHAPGAEQIPPSMRTHVIDALGLCAWAAQPTGPVLRARL